MKAPHAMAYTVNDTARMQQLIDFGVDGITTDRPRDLQQVNIPEPGTLSLLGTGALGLGGLGLLRRRKRVR